VTEINNYECYLLNIGNTTWFEFGFSWDH